MHDLELLADAIEACLSDLTAPLAEVARKAPTPAS
jgi:hypothetical protein